MQLDEWVLCRIYKKNSSSAQKPISSFSSKEQSYGESESSSSHLDDVLESLPDIDERFLSLPRMNSLNFQNLGSGSFDWASLAGLNSVPELGAGGGQSQGTMNNNNNNNCCNDMYVPSLPTTGHVESMSQQKQRIKEEEAQSGLRTQGLFQQNSNAYVPSFANSVESFGYLYPTQPSGFGFRQ